MTLTLEDLATIEWDWDLPVGCLVNHIDLFNQYGIIRHDVRSAVIRAKTAAAVSGRPVIDFLNPGL